MGREAIVQRMRHTKWPNCALLSKSKRLCMVILHLTGMKFRNGGISKKAYFQDGGQTKMAVMQKSRLFYGS